MGGLDVQIHEPANVLSTMLLAMVGGPKDARLHPIAAAAAEHVKPFRDHPSLAWLREFFTMRDFVPLYGHAAQLSGPVSFAPQTRVLPAYLANYEPSRMRELPARMSAFYGDAKLGTLRRALNSEYTLAAADVKDAVEGARIDGFLRNLYGTIKYKLTVVPLPTHPGSGGGTGAMTGWESFAFLHPPKVGPDAQEAVSWSSDPQATQVLAMHELSHALHDDAMRAHEGLLTRLWPLLERIPEDSPFARVYSGMHLRFAELFIRGSSASYVRRTRGDEEAQRWLQDQARRLGTTLVRDLFLAIEAYLGSRRWADLHAFLDDLPNVLGQG